VRGDVRGESTLNYKSSLLASALLLLVSTFVASSALGQGESEAAEVDYINGGRQVGAVGRTLSIGIGVGLELFDTNVKFTEKSTGRTVFIDMEGTLGMPETDVVPILYGYWRINDKHGIGFSYYQIRRENTLLDIDKSLGDLTIKGDIKMSDESSFSSLSYNYSVYYDDRAYVFLSLGVNVIDLKYSVDMEGMIDFDGTPIVSGEDSRGVNQIAPLPLIGIDAWFALTQKWAFGSKLSFIGGSYQDVTAKILEIKIRVKYTFNKNVGMSFGFNDFYSVIEIDEADLLTDIVYGFSGLKIGIDLGF
jgi:hypothetical protein